MKYFIILYSLLFFNPSRNTASDEAAVTFYCTTTNTSNLGDQPCALVMVFSREKVVIKDVPNPVVTLETKNIVINKNKDIYTWVCNDRYFTLDIPHSILSVYYPQSDITTKYNGHF
jgi:hypothetical protein